MFQQLNDNIPTTTTLLSIFERFRILFTVLYVIGFVAMLVYNFECYPGTNIGRIGWSIIWPLSVWGYLWEYWLNPESSEAVFRAGCFLIEEGTRSVR